MVSIISHSFILNNLGFGVKEFHPITQSIYKCHMKSTKCNTIKYDIYTVKYENKIMTYTSKCVLFIKFITERFQLQQAITRLIYGKIK